MEHTEMEELIVSDLSASAGGVAILDHLNLTVRKGDCLWNIAKAKLGSGARYTEIYNLNRNKIRNPNLIYPGQVLLLPY